MAPAPAAEAEHPSPPRDHRGASSPAPAHSPPATVAEALLWAAVEGGARAVFANPGTTEMWLVAGLDAVGPQRLRPVLCLQENVATGAADGYWRVSRRPALTLLHLGPGLANGLANLHNARRARSAVVNLVGDMATWHRANDPPLNSPLEALAATVSARVVRLDRPSGGADGGVGKAGGSVGGAAKAGGGGGREEGSGDANPAGALVDRLVAAVAPTVAAADVAAEATVGGRVVTVVVPHDLSWEPPPPPPPPAPPPASLPPASPTAAAAAEATAEAAGAAEATAEAAEAAEAFIRDCAAALLKAKAAAAFAGSTGGGKGAALLLGGEALLADGGALAAAGVVAAAAGATLLCEGAFARADRGGGLPALRRLPYFPQEAAAELRRYACVVLVDAAPPVANFGYKGGPGRLLPDADGDAGGNGGGGGSSDPAAPSVWELDSASLAAAGWDVAAALQRLAAALGPAAAAVQPCVNCGGVFAPPRRPPLPPPGRLTAAALCAAVAALQPEGAVVVDESLTSGSAYWEASQGCPPFTHLTLTGGAIGSGPPMALGAAIALAQEAEAEGGSPEGSEAGTGAGGGAAGGGAQLARRRWRRRRVINFQADGSAMYSLQALWTHARERLPVTTIIAANASYAILKVEAARQRLPSAGPATRALTDLGAPHLDWVALAGGMGVPGVRVDTTEALLSALERALAAPGPFLIQADV
ncbi:hypothetical protein HYH03_003718 [Edaphochlamys debaryana]|uniref:Acetolactate synthase large subunit n=1 Tax=Edaphochlamys debaryana TaxID=47281 RepID=A0A835YB48_9CHLO|nr:hypothetical protein HYH03_003718 [Edaphochlamys debaryana]|eukprot:KAG2498464.1 hypothetical protein HYH03_003718 [Edaphochlamys debaryana]